MEDHWIKHTSEADDAVAATALGRAIAMILLNFVWVIALVASGNTDETIKIWVVLVALSIAGVTDFCWQFWRMRRKAKARMR